MMNTTHRTVSAAVAAIEVSFIPVPTLVKVPLFLLGWYAGAAPDFDSKGASPSRELWIVTGFVSWLVRTTSFAVQTATGDGGTARRANGVHRKFSHTIEGCALAGLLIWSVMLYAGPLAPWAFWFGVVFASCAWSHSLLGDLFTKHGVPLSLIWNLLMPGKLWRDNHPPSWLPRAKTNKPSEHLVFMGAVRVFVMVAVVVALRLPLLPPVLLGAVVVGLVWHFLAVTGLVKALR